MADTFIAEPDVVLIGAGITSASWSHRSTLKCSKRSREPRARARAPRTTPAPATLPIVN
jgi:hypothetical protein